MSVEGRMTNKVNAIGELNVSRQRHGLYNVKHGLVEYKLIQYSA